MDSPAERVTHDHDLWEAEAHAAFHELQRRQEQMIATHGLSGDIQYHWSLDDAVISFSRNGQEFLRGRITSIGSVNSVKQTWLWSWANKSTPAIAQGDMAEVRRYGEEHGFPLRVWESFVSDPAQVQQAVGMAAQILDAEGMWRDRSGDLELWFLIRDLQPAAA